MKYTIRLYVSMILAVMVAASCQKKSRPELGDYPKDANPPGGPLKFYAAFDGSSTDPLMNAVDSIRANFASSNPLASVTGVSGKALQGAPDKAVKYSSANDFSQATSFTVAFWFKHTLNSNTEFYFSLKDDQYGWSKSALFMLVEHATATDATVKIGVMDQWLEFAGANKLQRPFFDGAWHHWAMSYNQATSKMTYYFDGQAIAAPAAATDVKNNGNPRGPLDFTKTNSLVIGGWNKHAGLDGPTDGWVGAFTGAIDQFRMYSTVLTPAEIQALFTNKL